MNKNLKIKICGMKFPQNIEAVSTLNPDMMGFIFYPNSPRYVERLDTRILQSLPDSIQKIGVFVNQKFMDTYLMVERYKLNGVQLHGNEPVEYCISFKKLDLIVLKAFPISEVSDFDTTKAYEGACNYFVFDTRTPAYGGSGVKFDWNILSGYRGETPFILSGGISLDDVETIKQINHPKFAGVDLNSKFELSPGLKSLQMLTKFIHQLKGSVVD